MSQNLLKCHNIAAHQKIDVQEEKIVIEEPVEEELPVEEAYGVEVIDGKGKVLIPGMIDAHVHILGGGGEGGPKTRTPEIMLSDIKQFYSQKSHRPVIPDFHQQN